MSRPTVILADDHRVFAEGLASLLAKDYEVIATAEDGDQLLAAVAETVPDVVVTDVSMPKLNGIECVRRLRAAHPDLKIVLLTMHEDVGLATTVIRDGASGFLLKNGGAKEVLRAIEVALEGGIHIATAIASDVMKALTNPRSAADLTPRQHEITRHLVEGLSTKQIAGRLHLSPRTVEFHKYQAMGRVGVETTAELIAYAVKNGLV